MSSHDYYFASIRPVTFKEAVRLLKTTKPYRIQLREGISLHGQKYFSNNSFELVKRCVDVKLTFWGRVRCFFSNYYYRNSGQDDFGVFTDDWTGYAVNEHNSQR